MFEDVYVVVVSEEEESQVTIVSLLQAKVDKAARIVFAATRGTEDSEIGIQDSHQMCLRLVSLLLLIVIIDSHQMCLRLVSPLPTSNLWVSIHDVRNEPKSAPDRHLFEQSISV